MEDAIDAPAATYNTHRSRMQHAPTEATPKMSNVKTAKPFSRLHKLKIQKKKNSEKNAKSLNTEIAYNNKKNLHAAVCLTSRKCCWADWRWKTEEEEEDEVVASGMMPPVKTSDNGCRKQQLSSS